MLAEIVESQNCTIIFYSSIMTFRCVYLRNVLLLWRGNGYCGVAKLSANLRCIARMIVADRRMNVCVYICTNTCVNAYMYMYLSVCVSTVAL